MDHTIEGSRIRDSYLCLLHGISEENREVLFDIAKRMYPEVAEVLIEQFRDTSPESADLRNKVIGATFMLLALVNSIIDNPVIEVDKSYSSASGNLGELPTFGKLRPLR